MLPFDNPSEKLDYLLFNESDRHLFAGDRLNYSCGTKFWSINGGVDTYHDQFMCTDLGVLNTPDESNGETWPTCQPQTESKSHEMCVRYVDDINQEPIIRDAVVVLAVQLMLEKYDRRISDRYKLIDFRELDNQRETTHLDDYFYTISIPVVCCKFLMDVLVAFRLPLIIFRSAHVRVPLLLLLQGREPLLQVVRCKGLTTLQGCIVYV